MAVVVCGVRPSLHAAYQARQQEVGVAVKSVYNKVNGGETQVSHQLVRQTAAWMRAIVGELKSVLVSEIDTLGYSAVAFFAFCLSLVACNLLRVVRAAVAGVHGVATVEKKVSSHSLAVEIGATWHGMMIAMPAEFWEADYGSLSTSELAARLNNWPAK